MTDFWLHDGMLYISGHIGDFSALKACCWWLHKFEWQQAQCKIQTTSHLECFNSTAKLFEGEQVQCVYTPCQAPNYRDTQGKWPTRYWRTFKPTTNQIVYIFAALERDQKKHPRRIMISIQLAKNTTPNNTRCVSYKATVTQTVS